MTEQLIKFSAQLDQDTLSAVQLSSELNCSIKLTPKKEPHHTNTSSASICLLFDCSLSMTGKKFHAAVATAKMIVDILPERHRISLIAFQSTSHAVFRHAVATESEKEPIKAKIDDLKHHLRGSTNMAAGIKHSTKILCDTEIEDEADANVIVLLSDGEADNPVKAQAAANVASERGIQIYAVGIGDSYNADQLLRLVTPSNGAVFGDSDTDNMGEIFYDIISRIDRILVTNARLDIVLDRRAQTTQVYKISPERALWDSAAKSGDDNSLSLRLGNIEDNKSYEFLLKLKLARLEVGVTELVKVRLQYEIHYANSKSTQSQEIVIPIECVDDVVEVGTKETFDHAVRGALIVEASHDLMQACAKSEFNHALFAIEKLEKYCQQENNSTLQQHLQRMKRELEKGRNISDKDRNEFLLATTVTPLKSQVFDLILINPGTETIRLVREIRNATGMDLRTIADMVQKRNSLIKVFNNRHTASQLQDRLRHIGAEVQIHAKELIDEN